MSLAGLLMGAGATATHASALASPGCLEDGSPAIVTGLAPELDLRLSDGRTVRLPGIDSLREISSETRDQILAWLVGKTVRVAPLGPSPDRWGRTAALVFAPNASGADTPLVSVAEALLDAGVVRARPSDGIAACWTTYLHLESDARSARRGIWADPTNRVLSAGDREGLSANLGQFVLIEGVAAALHDGRARTYVRFADVPAGGFALSFDRRTAERLSKAGVPPSEWLHRKLRIRGVLDDRWGLQIEVSSPQQVEVIGP